MRVVHPRPGTLEITQSRVRAASELAAIALFFIAWYSVLFASSKTPDQAPTLFMLLFWLAPFFSLPEIIRQARVLASGETFTLTRDTGTITRNGTHVARFSDVARIQIRTIRGSERSDEHRLSIVLKNDEKLRIHQSSDTKEIANIAEDLADVLNVQITRKA
jgi:hypothetical protein